MDNKSKIKVVKKSDVAELNKKAKKKATVSKREAAREMVSTVTNWVNDFQTKRRDETKLAFEQLFSQHPHPNES